MSEMPNDEQEYEGPVIIEFERKRFLCGIILSFIGWSAFLVAIMFFVFYGTQYHCESCENVL